jgi:hypothetical protein
MMIKLTSEVRRTPLPRVATPADWALKIHPVPVFPENFHKLPTPAGYAEAHCRYSEHKRYLQNAASASGPNLEVVPVNFYLKTWKPSRKTPLPIVVSNLSLKMDAYINYDSRSGYICETVSYIPAHIGVNDLKLTGVTAVAHKYAKWTKGLILAVDDVELRMEQWEELLPKGEGALDVDAIIGELYKKVKGKLRFAGKLVQLVLAISYEQYDVALASSVTEDIDDLESTVNAKVMINCH